MRSWVVTVIAGALGWAGAGCSSGRDANVDLCVAAMLDDLAGLERALDAGAAIDGPCVGGEHDLNGTPLTVAASNARLRPVRWLLDHGAAPNVADGEGVTPLLHAVRQDDVKLTAELITRGAGAADDEGLRLLDEAGAERHAGTALLRALVRAGAPVKRAGAGGLTALHHAARKDDAVLVRELAERGADVNAAAHDGATPLDLARRAGAEAAAKALLALGAGDRGAAAPAE